MESFDLLAAASQALGRFGTKLSQHARLVTLASSQDGALPESLMAERVRGREAVGELYAFEVDALSTATDLDLDQFIGEELTVTLLQPDDTRRAWRGCALPPNGWMQMAVFECLWVEHEARNNIDANVASVDRTGWIEPGTYRNRKRRRNDKTHI